MPAPLLYPVHVSAKVIKQATTVPRLDGAPFNRDLTLEPGIHVHWALPDVLTRAQMPKRGSSDVLFPGVPDLWLVIRFHPGVSSGSPFAKRAWTAWVVDSFASTVTALDQWEPVLSRSKHMIHTFAGILPMAMGKSRAYGLFNPKSDKTIQFDPAMAGYYPACRKRFGFHDNLAGLANPKQGNLSYLVVGWFADSSHDPLGNTKSPSRTLQRWRSEGVKSRVSSAALLATNINAGAHATPPLKWNPDFAVRSGDIPDTSARGKLAARNTLRSGDVVEARARVQSREKLFASAASRIEQSDSISSVYAPREVICHGAVLEVPLSGGDSTLAPLQDSNITLYPNVRRMAADLASKPGATSDHVDAVEMLLGDLDAQKSSVAGIIDLPGAAHALTFQSVPGKAHAYARLTIEPGKPGIVKPLLFDLGHNSMSLRERGASGFWPELHVRAASLRQKRQRVPSHLTRQPQAPNLAQLAKALNDTVELAKAKGISVHPRLVRVDDTRPNARSLQLGPTADGSGSDSASYFLDMNDKDAVMQVLKTMAGAQVVLPSAEYLYVQPGPRWYRSWAPQMALTDIGRSYKFGFDDRFGSARGGVKVRRAGETVSAMTVAEWSMVAGQELALNPERFRKEGVPAAVESLVNEMLLLDTESAGAMATASGAAQNTRDTATKHFSTAIRALWFSRDPSKMSPNVMHAVMHNGVHPSPIAISPWQNPVDPLFADVNYAHPRSVLSDWELKPDAVEMTAKGPQATVPAVGNVTVLNERTKLTASVTKVLASSLVTQITIDPLGRKRRKQVIDKNLKEETFTQMNVLSGPLTKFDEMLFQPPHNLRLRAGALRLNKIDVIDMFGMARPWKAPVADPASPAGGPEQPYWLELPPRLPGWGRFTFRLQQSSDTSKEADGTSTAVCGILFPDFVEHALEVFDSSGVGIGQLVTDKPRILAPGPFTLRVRFETHPWVSVPSGGDPTAAIANPTLRALVQAIAAQELSVPANTNPEWSETGLSAMLRVIDTIRGSLDPGAQKKERKVTLLGDPIVVLVAKLKLEEVSAGATSQLAANPPASAADAPPIHVRIGDISRPDDGVLGCFIAGASASGGRFAPVTTEAAEKALINPVAFDQIELEATHAFVKDMECLFTLPPNGSLDIVILADIRGGLYATCGVLPRKKITIPSESIEKAVRALQPSFFAGPVLTVKQTQGEKVLVPPPAADGFIAEFVMRSSDGFATSEVPPAPPLSELPGGRVILSEGWFRLKESKPGP